MVLTLSVSAQERRTTVYEYIEKYKKVAVEEMHRTRIPASITMAQALLESSNGNSRLAKEGNNHFGIKCKKGWTGKTIYEDDDEEQECFRGYETAEDSYKDHSEFLTRNVRYAFLFDLEPTDYKGWANGLRKAGYATNPNYATILIDLIERHRLFELDKLKPGDFNIKTEVPIAGKDTLLNKIPAVRVGEGDDVPEIAARYEMRPRQIYKYNDLPAGTTIQPGDILYLKPKHRRGSSEYHVVKEGETMHYISQLYAIKLKQLYKKNRMVPGTQPKPGETLYMRHKADEPADTVSQADMLARKNKDDQRLTESKVTHKPSPTVDTAYGHPYKPAFAGRPAKDTTAKVTEDKVYMHTVKAGETLFSIARQYNKSVEQIMELNNLSGYGIHQGQQLIINGNQKEKSPDVARTDFYHVVKAGETLYGIARLYNMSVKELKELNTLSSDALSAGQKLYVYKAPASGTGNTQNSEAANEPTHHIVKKGETLFSIARSYGVTVDQIRKWNGLPADNLSIGQSIRIKD